MPKRVQRRPTCSFKCKNGDLCKKLVIDPKKADRLSKTDKYRADKGHRWDYELCIDHNPKPKKQG